MHLTLRDFSMVGFTFKPTQRLGRIQRLAVRDMITEAARDLPETTTCEGDLRDPRCPASGRGDINDILLAAFDDRGDLKGALHFSAINLISQSGNTFVVGTHPTPAFPELNVAEIAAFILAAAKFVLGSDLRSIEGPILQIRSINYALEIPFRSGSKFEAIHKILMTNGVDFVTEDDPTRASRKLHSVKPVPVRVTRVR